MHGNHYNITGLGDTKRMIVARRFTKPQVMPDTRAVRYAPRMSSACFASYTWWRQGKTYGSQLGTRSRIRRMVRFGSRFIARYPRVQSDILESRVHTIAPYAVTKNGQAFDRSQPLTIRIHIECSTNIILGKLVNLMSLQVLLPFWQRYAHQTRAGGPRLR